MGVLLWNKFQVRLGMTSKQMVLASLGCMMIVPIWGLIGFSQVVGFVYPVEIFAFATVYGSLLGPIQSATRTCFCSVIPPGQESEFFGVYEITDKGSGWLGPLVAGLMYEATGTLRTGFTYILFMGCIGWYLVYITDFEEGADACRRKGVQVKMEAVRSKMGVSKVQIQMNANKFLGVNSSRKSSNKSGKKSGKSGGQSGASSAASSAASSNVMSSAMSSHGTNASSVAGSTYESTASSHDASAYESTASSHASSCSTSESSAEPSSFESGAEQGSSSFESSADPTSPITSPVIRKKRSAVNPINE